MIRFVRSIDVRGARRWRRTRWQTHAGTRSSPSEVASVWAGADGVHTVRPTNSRVFVSAASKKGRQTYQRYQTSVLEQKFQQSSYVSKKQREELRLQTNLTDRQIKIWFQNRRMKAKKEKQRIDDHGEHAPLLAWPPAPPHPYQYPLCPP
ncbi:unnamed protein product [Heligmosomoides polygyrus]|uniref:Homeobox domain-containing protein n=1 Tax=Heligmosomoides polygyrus TaxID=6339 RepID=A0A3P8CEC8_HELPZ|nr:unnamed protein product [Heligmosomoides polygyrus]